MSKKRSIKPSLSLDAACEDVANFLNTSTQKIAILTRNSIDDALNDNFNNVNYSTSTSKKDSNEISLIARGSKNGTIQEIRLLFKLILPRGNAPGNLSGERLLKISRTIDGKTELVKREIL